jgi:hypothetical protein
MRSLGFSRYLLSISVVVVLLCACGGPQPPIGAPGASPQTAALATHAESGTSWMLPEAKGKDLMYVAADTGWIYITTYPDGAEVGSINLYPYFSARGACADSSGNVWIAGVALVEFAHGATKPTETRQNGAEPFQGCAVDPLTGDLAATSYAEAKVLVWRQPRKTPKVYSERSASLRYCGYDDRGNLFVDAVTDGAFLLLELVRGGHKLERLTFHKKISSPAEVQWDGRYITIEDAAPPARIYEVKVSGTTASVVNTIRFSDHGKTATQSWIQDSTVLIPHSTTNRFIADALGLFEYPAGGRAVVTLRGEAYRGIAAVTVSVPPK